MEAEQAYQAVARKIRKADSEKLIKLLKSMMSPDQARIAIELPCPDEELAQKVNLDVETVRKECDDLYRRGIVFPTRKGYQVARMTVQLHDASQSNIFKDHIEERDLLEAWEEYAQAEYYGDYAYYFSQLPRPFRRVLPMYKAVENVPGVQPYENAKEIMKAANRIALADCSCRKRAVAMHRECKRALHRNKKLIYENCIQLDRGADYVIARGSGYEISVEEAIKILDRIEEDGLVHSWPNSRTMHGIIMCSCCDDCCEIWMPMKKMYNVPISKRWAKSRFQAVVDPDLCKGCGACLERCQFDAREMKINPSDGKLKAYVDPEKCFGCGSCVITCYPGATKMKLVRPESHIPTEVEARELAVIDAGWNPRPSD